MATGMTLAVPQAVSVAAGNLVKQLPQKLNDALQAVTAPILRSPALHLPPLRLGLPELHAAAPATTNAGVTSGIALQTPANYSWNNFDSIFHNSSAGESTRLAFSLVAPGGGIGPQARLSLTGPMDAITSSSRYDSFALAGELVPGSSGGYEGPRSPFMLTSAADDSPKSSALVPASPIKPASPASDVLALDDGGSRPTSFADTDLNPGATIQPDGFDVTMLDATPDAFSDDLIRHTPDVISSGGHFDQTLTGNIVATQSTHVVPEPTGLVFLAGALLLLKRRRGNRRVRLWV
jgi:hypothetical protein